MSSVSVRMFIAIIGLSNVFLLSACDEPVTRQGFHKQQPPLKKGNATIQMDAKFVANGDVVINVTSLSDLSFVDIKTKIGEEWRELARLQDLKSGEPQTLTLQGPFDGAQYIWATGTGTDAKWVAQSRIFASEGASASAPSAKTGISSLNFQEEEQSQKLKAEFSGKKVME
ncbi:MAG: hypothetical protein K2X47_17965 [Bdellovibrionales bacterium]|nr:hypothetical protein [Bdellovibrionales bacterium]